MLQDTSEISANPEIDILDMLPVGACVFSDDLVIEQWNNKLEEWTGFSRSEMIGTDLSDRFPNVREPRYFQRLKQVFDTGMPAKYSAALHKHFLPVPVRHGLNGLAGEFMVQETEIRLFSNEPKLAFCTIQDFSFQYGQVNQLKNERADLVQMKEQLERTNRRLRTRNDELDEFCHVASHDLQNPLAKLISLGQLLERGARNSLDFDGSQCLDGILDNSRRMRAIIIDLLALSRSGKAELDMDRVSTDESAKIALDLLASRISQRDAEIEIDKLPDVVGDVAMIARVYQNLISNSLSFTPDDRKPLIRLTAERDGAWWKLGVLDNGVGIEKDHFDEVFRPFQKLNSAKQNHDGSGVGLTICKKAINRMGGEISIDSELGRGCEVTFTLLAASDSGDENEVGDNGN